MEILKNTALSIVTGVLRLVMTSLATWLLTNQVIDQGTFSQMKTILPVILAGVVWSIFEKYVLAKIHLNQIQLALNLPQGSDLETLKSELKVKRTTEKLPPLATVESVEVKVEKEKE